ncbi:MAG: transposase [Deltaproteobacteria bacterium]|nr:transposase [Deltaproteobacteria bacterium]MBW2660632.1 transposase [Deltaproteobacteria bacterium]
MTLHLFYAKLIKSASHPISNNQIKELKDRKNTFDGKLDKNGKPVKFSRDMKSDWTIKNDKAHYGLKEHVFIDVNHGFILSTTLTPASVSNSIYLLYCTTYSKHTKQPIKKVYADKDYP